MILVADNVNGLNPVVADALNRFDPVPIRRLVQHCEQAGAQAIDINPGYLPRKKLDRMKFMVNTVQESTSLPLTLDSPNPYILAAGLSVCRDKPILSALSAEPAKLDGIIPLAVEHKTTLVILLMDEGSFSPRSAEEKIALALELAEHAQSAGLSLDDLIFDPILPNMTWNDARERTAENLKLIRLFSSGAVFGVPVRTMIGLSNLRSGMRNRIPADVENICMALFAGSGLDYLLADVLRQGFRAAYEGVMELAG